MPTPNGGSIKPKAFVIPSTPHVEIVQFPESPADRGHLRNFIDDFEQVDDYDVVQRHERTNLPAGLDQSQMALVESENFAIYSNIQFLYLIGKYAAQTRQCHEEGLKSLNDYLLILDYFQDAVENYLARRALALYQLGLILYNEKHYSEACKYLQLAIEDLGKKEKEVAQKKVSKVWQM